VNVVAISEYRHGGSIGQGTSSFGYRSAFEIPVAMKKLLRIGHILIYFSLRIIS
jgi:hypothetical protein